MNPKIGYIASMQGPARPVKVITRIVIAYPGRPAFSVIVHNSSKTRRPHYTITEVRTGLLLARIDRIGRSKVEREAVVLREVDKLIAEKGIDVFFAALSRAPTLELSMVPCEKSPSLSPCHYKR